MPTKAAKKKPGLAFLTPEDLTRSEGAELVEAEVPELGGKVNVRDEITTGVVMALWETDEGSDERAAATVELVLQALAKEDGSPMFTRETIRPLPLSKLKPLVAAVMTVFASSGDAKNG